MTVTIHAVSALGAVGSWVSSNTSLFGSGLCAAVWTLTGVDQFDNRAWDLVEVKTCLTT